MPIYDTSDDVLITGTNGADEIHGYPETSSSPSYELPGGLYRPLFATAPKDAQGQLKDHLKNHLFVVSQGGKITAHDLANPQAARKTFIEIPVSEIGNADEAGLLGFTFHPQFATNGKCYVNYTEQNSREQVIVEYTIDLNDTRSPPASTSRKIMTIDYPDDTTHHRAGWIDFGSDGMLYIATGDGWRIEGTRDSNANAAQTLVNPDGSINHLGKILRIDVSGDDFADPDRNYSIPKGADGIPANPTSFQGVGTPLPQPSEIWAIGLRNPWRASFGPDGKLYVADVGQDNFEEINIVEAGKNYGWRAAPLADGPQHSPDSYTDPYHSYGRSVGQSVTGGYFYTGDGSLKGKYIFGDYVAGKIFAMDVSGTTPQVQDVTHLFKDAQGTQLVFEGLTSFGRDAQGNLYAITYGDAFTETGKVYRLSDSTPITDDPDSIEAGAGDDTVYGGSGDDTIHGGADNDRLYGEADNDHLHGNAGADILTGGAGSDIYYVDGSDRVIEIAGQGEDEIRATESFALDPGQAVEILRAWTAESETAIDLTGNELAQRLIGNAGANVLNGRGGADTLEGGAGDDTYVVYGGDTIDETIEVDGVEVDAGGIDTVRTAVNNYTLGTNLENLTLLGTSAIDGNGNALANRITGNDAANSLSGADGIDTLTGAGGADTLNGGDEADRLIGGTGDDTYILDGNDVIVEEAGEGTDTVTSAQDYTLGANLENLTLLGSATTGTGNTLENIIVGNNGTNTLDGGGGADTLRGRSGDDTIYGGADSDDLYGDEGDDDLVSGNAAGFDFSLDTLTGGAGDDLYYVNGGDRVVELDGTDQGNDEIRALEAFTLEAGQAVEVLRAWPSNSQVTLNLTGNEFSQDLIGNAAANRLNGGGGADILEGLGGNDTYVVNTTDDAVSETDVIGRDTGGIDTVETTVTYSLSDYVENLTLQGTSAINGTGNELANTIIGNDAANIINGDAGADTLDGRGGNDTYRVDNQNDAITEGAGGDVDTLIASASYTLAGAAHLEILRADGTAAINLTGNDFANTFHGNSANNRFDGKDGQDTVVLTGQRSDYEITLNGETLTIKDTRANGDGTDTVIGAEIFQFSDGKVSFENILNTPPDGVRLERDVIRENSTTGTAVGKLLVTDNANDKHLFTLVDNAGGRFSLDADGTLRVANAVLIDYEQAQKHTIEVTITDSSGGKLTRRIDVTVQDWQAERAVGSALADVIKGGYGNDVLSGVGGNDLLSAGIGNDRLIGGLGKDTLTGNSGRDVFVFDDRDTGTSKSRADYITDFSGRQGDRLDLKLVDANSSKRGDQNFSFIGKNAFSKAGEVRYEKTKTDTYVYLNTDNDKAAEAVIRLKGSFDLQKSWFVL